MTEQHAQSKEKPVPSLEENIQSADLLAPEEQRLLEKVESNPKIVAMIASRHHQGPLPAPEDLAHYNELIPNGAERIMRMAEKEQEHRMELNKNEQIGKFQYLKTENALKSKGQWFAVSTILLFVILSGVFIYHQQYIYGFWIMTSSLVAIVAIFVTGKYIEKTQHHDNDE